MQPKNIAIAAIILAILAGAAWYLRPTPNRGTDNSAEKYDLIRVTAPLPNTTVSGSITITGEARGTWFFEASFPVRLLDSSGTQIAVAIAQAQGEWMTTEFVPFETTLDIPDTTRGPATLVFEKDNPSGLPEHDDSLSIPVTVQ